MCFKSVLLIFLLKFCFRENGIIAKRCDKAGKLYCCDNHEEINGVCILCNTGFISEWGNPCHPCPSGFYGDRCLSACRCTDTERCDNVKGCVNLEQSTTQMYKESTFSSVNLEPELSQTSSPPLMKGTTITENDATLLGLSKRELVVYTSCTGLLSIFILVCLLCIRRYKLKNHNNSLRVEQARPINNSQAIEVNVEETEGLYETIDESNMLDEPLGIIENRNERAEFRAILTNGESVDSLTTNAYITPCNTGESSSTTSHSDSSVPEDKDGESGYLNPYQQIINSKDHEYKSICIKLNTPESSKQVNESTSAHEYHSLKKDQIEPPPTYIELQKKITKIDDEATMLKTICDNEVQSDITNDTAPNEDNINV